MKALVVLAVVCLLQASHAQSTYDSASSSASSYSNETAAANETISLPGWALLTEHDYVGAPKLYNEKPVTIEECSGLCDNTESCQAFVFYQGPSACKLLPYTHLMWGEVVPRNETIYGLRGTNGCLNSQALNYVAEAIFDDGSCEYDLNATWACTDSTALNFNSTATHNLPDECEYRPKYTLWYGKHVINVDRLGKTARVNNFQECLDTCEGREGCLSFNFRSNGNFPRCYLFGMRWGDNAIMEFALDEDYIHASLGYDGCTNSYADNYDPDAYYDSLDSCIYDPSVTQSCHSTYAVNFDPSGNIHNETLCDYFGDWIVEYDTIYYRTPLLERITRPIMYWAFDPWWCRNRCENDDRCVAFSYFWTRYCFTYTHYDLSIDEEGNNGLRFFDRMEFWRVPDYYGCTNSYANNYNPNSRVDDGTCEYPEGTTFGCLVSTAFNYEPSVQVHVESDCDFVGSYDVYEGRQYMATPALVKYTRDDMDGSTDPLWCRQKCDDAVDCEGFNFLPGSHCQLFDTINLISPLGDGNGTVSNQDWVLWTIPLPFGCMHPLASNYDAAAVFDNGNCSFDSVPVVCKDPFGKNYVDDPYAVHNDTECDYYGGYAMFENAQYIGTAKTASFDSTYLKGLSLEHTIGWCRQQCDTSDDCVTFNVKPALQCQLFNSYEVVEDAWGMHGLMFNEDWYTFAMDILVGCPADHYAQEFECVACPDGGTSPVGSTDVADCVPSP